MNTTNSLKRLKRAFRARRMDDYGQKAYSIVLELWDKKRLRDKLETKVFFLDKAGAVLGSYDFPDETHIEPDIALLEAQKKSAESFILAQSDPNDDVFPNDYTNRLLEKFKTASNRYQIKLTDFLVFSEWGYVSSRENNRL